jgi:hypothetical protein
MQKKVLFEQLFSVFFGTRKAALASSLFCIAVSALLLHSITTTSVEAANGAKLLFLGNKNIAPVVFPTMKQSCTTTYPGAVKKEANDE